MFYRNLYGRKQTAPTSTDWTFFPLIDKKHFEQLADEGWTFQKLVPKGCYMMENRSRFADRPRFVEAAQS